MLEFRVCPACPGLSGQECQGLFSYTEHQRWAVSGERTAISWGSSQLSDQTRGASLRRGRVGKQAGRRGDEEIRDGDVSGVRALVGLRQAQETRQRLPDSLREVCVVVHTRHVCWIFRNFTFADIRWKLILLSSDSDKVILPILSLNCWIDSAFCNFAQLYFVFLVFFNGWMHWESSWEY